MTPPYLLNAILHLWSALSDEARQEVRTAIAVPEISFINLHVGKHRSGLSRNKYQQLSILLCLTEFILLRFITILLLCLIAAVLLRFITAILLRFNELLLVDGIVVMLFS